MNKFLTVTKDDAKVCVHPQLIILLKSFIAASILVSFSCVLLLWLTDTKIIDNKLQSQKQAQTDKKITVKTQQTPIVIIKKPVVIEKGSKAHFCLKNNGGSDCLKRDRFALNYKITPPKPQKTYEDYLIQYGIREPGYCGRYFNGRPNC